jgi:2-phosphosulfolactate phosphatase
MEICLASLTSGAAAAVGTTVIIDVFRAFTTAAIALSRGARRVIMVDTLDKALALRSSGVGDYCIGERDSIKPRGFDFGNSPAELGRAEVAGKTLIQTTSNGTVGMNAALGADRIYAGAFVTSEATVRAILRHAPTVVTLVAIGRSNGTVRADEDELCALYLRARLEGRQPDVAAIRAVLATMPAATEPEAYCRRVLRPEGSRDRCRGRCHCLCNLGPTRSGIADRGSGEKRPSTGVLIVRVEARPHRRSRGSAGSNSRRHKETVGQRLRWMQGVCPLSRRLADQCPVSGCYRKRPLSLAWPSAQNRKNGR